MNRLFLQTARLTDTGIHPWTTEELRRRTKTFPSLIEQQLKAPPGSFLFLFSPEDSDDFDPS